MKIRANINTEVEIDPLRVINKLMQDKGFSASDGLVAENEKFYHISEERSGHGYIDVKKEIMEQDFSYLKALSTIYNSLSNEKYR